MRQFGAQFTTELNRRRFRPVQQIHGPQSVLVLGKIPFFTRDEHTDRVPLRILKWPQTKGRDSRRRVFTLVARYLTILLILTSESAPLSAPGQVNVTYSWHRLWTTKLHTAKKKTHKGLFKEDVFSLNGHVAFITFLKPLQGKWKSYTRYSHLIRKSKHPFWISLSLFTLQSNMDGNVT